MFASITIPTLLLLARASVAQETETETLIETETSWSVVTSPFVSPTPESEAIYSIQTTDPWLCYQECIQPPCPPCPSESISGLPTIPPVPIDTVFTHPILPTTSSVVTDPIPVPTDTIFTHPILPSTDDLLSFPSATGVMSIPAGETPMSTGDMTIPVGETPISTGVMSIPAGETPISTGVMTTLVPSNGTVNPTSTGPLEISENAAAPTMKGDAMQFVAAVAGALALL